MSNIPALIRRNKFTLHKTASYFVMHIIVAVLVAYAVTGSWVAAIALSLIEPAVQSVAFFFHEKAWSQSSAFKLKLPAKTASYYLMHILVAAGVTYAVTRDAWTALTLSLLEPTVQMVCYFFHEKVWAVREAKYTAAPTPV